MTFKIKEKVEFGRLATFIPNKQLPVYNWFYFKEGFSKELVFKLVDMFNLKGGDWLLDPFCGCGTTNLACKQLGINSIGFDTLPVSIFVSKVKTTDYEISQLKKSVKEFLKIKFRKPYVNVSNNVKCAFSRFVLEDIIIFKDEIMKIKDNDTRNFLLLGLMNSAMKCSYAFKDGSIIKLKTKSVPPLRDMLRRQLYKMIHDLEYFETKPCSAIIDYCDARKLKLDDNSIDAIITSPPYLNKIEYTRIYEIEQELFLPKEKTTGIRSFIGLREKNLEKDFSEIDIFFDSPDNTPLTAKAYIEDMLQVIKEMYRVCKPGTRVAIVVGNACFPTGVVDVDIILSNIAEKIGFHASQILVLNKRVCTTPSRRKVGIMRESLLMWEKQI